MRRIRGWLSDRRWKRQMEAERKAEDWNERRRLLRGKELVEAVYAILYEFDPIPEAEVLIYGAGDVAKAKIHASNESVDPDEIESLIVAEALLLERWGTR